MNCSQVRTRSRAERSAVNSVIGTKYPISLFDGISQSQPCILETIDIYGSDLSPIEVILWALIFVRRHLSLSSSTLSSSCSSSWMLASRISHARRLSVLLPRIVRTASTTQRPSYKFEPSTGNRRKDPMAEIHHPPTPDRDDSHISKKARLEDEGGAETAHVVPSDEAMHDTESSAAQQPKAKPAKNRNKKRKKHKIPAFYATHISHLCVRLYDLYQIRMRPQSRISVDLDADFLPGKSEGSENDPRRMGSGSDGQRFACTETASITPGRYKVPCVHII